MHKIVIEVVEGDGSELLGGDKARGTMRASVVAVPGGVPYEVVRGTWHKDAVDFYRVSFELAPHAGATGFTPTHLRLLAMAARLLAPIVAGDPGAVLEAEVG